MDKHIQLLETKLKTATWYCSDAELDRLYPPAIQELTRQHFTNVIVAKRAAEFLAAEPGMSILDIGSGSGKFCLTAAHHQPSAFYYGIEQRKNLVAIAEAVQQTVGITNVKFMCGNFTQLDFSKYDHFYFYNSFYENLNGTSKIDNSIDYSAELYYYYNRYLYKQLEQKPEGTRLATYHSLEDEIPPCYHVVQTDMNELLKFWIKI
jgi:SAM-dependent methyltransferase